ncbi:MAG TPA: TonB-dependent receptor [Sphingobium sp.]|uniref:TonB-dependent receptor n=1 Tax=Sphingobium sp. TaxID=1912891 RepID=UPI002ED3FAEB
MITGDQEIVVTAQRRSERSVDVPITVSTLDQSQLRTANVNQLSDTVKLTPGLRFDSQGPAVQPTIRGVGTAITTSGGGPNVGIYVDGFFQANTYVSDFQLMKVQNIQVLKGPQGTLFGRNTTGGAILVTTADPSTDTSAEFKASYGRYNTLTVQGYATFGLTDKVAMDIEGIYSRGDGFQTNLANGDDNVGRYKSWSVRTGIKAELSDSVSVLLRYTHAQSDNPSTQLVNAFVDTTGEAGFFSKVSAAGQAAYGRSNSAGLPLVNLNTNLFGGNFATKAGDVALTFVPYFHTRSDTVQGTIKADLGFADLTSYTQYRYDNTPYTGDLDVTTLPFFGIFVGVRDSTFSQEFLLNSHPGSRLQWTAGANYFQNRDTWDVQASFGGPFNPFGGSSTFTTSIAAFADVTYAITPDKLFLTVGGRFSHDVVSDAYFKTNSNPQDYQDADGSTATFVGPVGTAIPVDNLRNNSFTPRVVVRYKPGEHSSVYASYSRGYKAGILNVGGLSKVPVKPENIDAFEVGYKYGDRVLSIDLASYYYNYKNLQVSSFQNGAAQIRNAASSEIYGAEAALRYKVTKDFTVNGGVTWTHARYKSFTNAPYYSYCDPVAPTTPAMACGPIGPGSLTQTTTDASGYQMQRAPSWTGNVGASYGLDVAKGRLTLSGNLYYTSSFYFDPSQQFRQKPYETLSLRAEWIDPSQKYTLAVYGDNVTNRRYQSQVLFNTLGIGSVWNSPVTYGVSAGVKF